MKRFAAGALCGSLLLQHCPVLPHAGWLVALAAALSLCVRYRWIVASGLVGGFGWALAFALLHVPLSLPASLAAADVTLVGIVATPVEHRGGRARFELVVEEGQGDAAAQLSGLRVRFNWYGAPPGLSADQRWRLVARLRPPHGLANPGGFDFEGWLYRRGIGATGYVRPDAPVLLEERVGRFPLARLRERLSAAIGRTLGEVPAAGVIQALAVGDRSAITPALWETFRRTGTSHLMAISGLHIGLVAGVMAWLASLAWRRVPALCGRWPAQQAAALAGLLGAIPYAALAGFTLPTQRALIMLAVAVGALLARRTLDPPQALALALLAALARDPAGVAEPGFWLSFGAVAVILLAVSQRAQGGLLRRWWRVQAGLSLGLAPALLAFGFPVPLVGLLANAAAVPWYGFLVVPATLLGTLLQGLVPGLGEPLLGTAAWFAGVSLPVLEALADGSFATLPLPEAPSPPALLLGALGLVLLMMPAGAPGRYVGVFLVLPLVFGSVRLDALPSGDFRVTVLDVGQGLAVVVETRSRVLLFDTGPAYTGGFDSGSRVIAPFLAQRGRGHVDRLILSHADIDHVGGTGGLLAGVEVHEILAGEREAPVPAQARPCPDGERWYWDRVQFTLLHPGARLGAIGNDASCVLRVENAAGALLLTGDIEQVAEAELIRARPDLVRAEVVVAPHHGSRTSSSPAFVSGTGADYVVYSAGFRNRYGFPAAEVAARWSAAGARELNTAVGGALQFDFRAAVGLGAPRVHRQRYRRYWHYRTAP